jgi:hypothetical protein
MRLAQKLYMPHDSGTLFMPIQLQTPIIWSLRKITDPRPGAKPVIAWTP